LRQDLFSTAQVEIIRKSVTAHSWPIGRHNKGGGAQSRRRPIVFIYIR
jgi:hypothetical protein